MIFGYKPWNLFWAVKQEDLLGREREQWITPRHQGSKLGEGAGSGSLEGWRHGKRSVLPHSSENGLAGWLLLLLCWRFHIMSLFLPYWLEISESYEEGMCLLKFGPQVHPWERSVHCRFSKRSKHLCLSSQQTFTAGGERIICGNQVAWKCTRGVGMDTGCPEDVSVCYTF